MEFFSIPDLPITASRLFYGAGIAFFLWAVLSLFLLWRRQVTNLTPVDRPRVNPDASPDYLTVDHVKRKAALTRGDQFAAQVGLDVRPTAIQKFVQLIRLLAGVLTVALASILVVWAVWNWK